VLLPDNLPIRGACYLSITIAQSPNHTRRVRDSRSLPWGTEPRMGFAPKAQGCRHRRLPWVLGARNSGQPQLGLFRVSVYRSMIQRCQRWRVVRRYIPRVGRLTRPTRGLCEMDPVRVHEKHGNSGPSRLSLPLVNVSTHRQPPPTIFPFANRTIRNGASAKVRTTRSAAALILLLGKMATVAANRSSA